MREIGYWSGVGCFSYGFPLALLLLFDVLAGPEVFEVVGEDVTPPGLHGQNVPGDGGLRGVRNRIGDGGGEQQTGEAHFVFVSAAGLHGQNVPGEVGWRGVRNGTGDGGGFSE